MEGLRGCPTCGNSNIVHCIEGEPGHENKWTQCNDCGTTTEFGNWNTRHSDARIAELEQKLKRVEGLSLGELRQVLCDSCYSVQHQVFDSKCSKMGCIEHKIQAETIHDLIKECLK